MRLDFHLDTDPEGRGTRARWWALVLVFVAVIVAEIALLGVLVYAVTHG